MTSGGIFGTNESVSNDTVILKVADKVKLEIAKNYIVGIREKTKKTKKG